MELGKIEALLQSEWLVISGAPFLFTAAVIAVGIMLWGALTWAYATRLASVKSQADSKDATIELLREQLCIVQKSQRARRVAEELGVGASEIEREALALLADRRVRETFYRLTDDPMAPLPWNPVDAPARTAATFRPGALRRKWHRRQADTQMGRAWAARGILGAVSWIMAMIGSMTGAAPGRVPSEDEIADQAVVATLFESGYATRVPGSAPSGYVVTASEQARNLRNILDSLPDHRKESYWRKVADV